MDIKSDTSWTIPCTRCNEPTIKVEGFFKAEVPHNYSIFCVECKKLIRFLPTMLVIEIPKKSELG